MEEISINIRARRTCQVEGNTEVFYRALFSHVTPTEGKSFSGSLGGILGNISEVY